MASSSSKHFLLLFRDQKCQYRGLYTWDEVRDHFPTLHFLTFDEFPGLWHRCQNIGTRTAKVYRSDDEYDVQVSFISLTWIHKIWHKPWKIFQIWFGSQEFLTNRHETSIGYNWWICNSWSVLAKASDSPLGNACP